MQREALLADNNEALKLGHRLKERGCHRTGGDRQARRLGLVWGLEPRVATQPRGIAAMTDEAAHMAADLGLAEPGGRVLIIAGPPLGAPGAANLLRLAHAPRARPGSAGERN